MTAYSPNLLAELIVSNSKTIEFIPPPPDRSATGDRGEAASRGCDNSDRSLVALVLSYQQTIDFNKEETIPFTKVWG